MASQPVLIGAHGGTVHQLRASEGELFQVCFRGLCLSCDSLTASADHLRRLERLSVSCPEAA